MLLLYRCCTAVGRAREGATEHGVDRGQATGGTALHGGRRAQAAAPAGHVGGRGGPRAADGERERVPDDDAEAFRSSLPLLSPLLPPCCRFSDISVHDGFVKVAVRFAEGLPSKQRGPADAFGSLFVVPRFVCIVAPFTPPVPQTGEVSASFWSRTCRITKQRSKKQSQGFRKPDGRRGDRGWDDMWRGERESFRVILTIWLARSSHRRPFARTQGKSDAATTAFVCSVVALSLSRSLYASLCLFG